MSEVPANAPTQDDALSPPTFDVLPLSAETRATLAKMGYIHPTPVQRAVFEPASHGKDLVVQARTGTGKTAAFGLPIIEHLVRRSQNTVQTLCLCPTRELALQVASELERLGEGRQIKPVAVYGGVPMGRQIESLRSGAQVVVGTPGRVLDHIRRKTLPTATIRSLVLDEADEMLSMGFERELNAILDALPRDRQTLLFSATVPPDIERIARDRLRHPEFITLSSDAVGALSISHFVYFLLEDKLGALLQILETENPESAIIFCNTKAETENLAAALVKAGYNADWLNGDLPQNEREAVVNRIRNGTLRFLVATDVAARGIDISHLTHVINYDFPENSETYVHRTGRTGRAGRTGTAISLVHPQDIGNLYFLRLAYKIKPFERSLPTAQELKTRHELDLINHLVETFGARELDPDDLQLARRFLSHDRAEILLAHLLRQYFGDRTSAELGAAAARRAKNPPPSPPVLPPSEPRSREEIQDRTTAQGRERDRNLDRGSRDRKDRRNDRNDREERRGERRNDRPRNDRPREERPHRHVHEVASVAPEEPPLPEPVSTELPPVEPPAPSVEEPATTKFPPVAGAPLEPSSVEITPAPQNLHQERPAYERKHRRSRTPPNEEDVEFRHTVSDPSASSPPASPLPTTTSSSPSPQERLSDLAHWHPPEEENDDLPIWNRPETHEASSEHEFAVLFLDVGRREGMRPSDVQRLLRDRAGIHRRDTGRIRVRDRHTLVALRRELMAQAIDHLTGIEVGGRTIRAEQARDQDPNAD
ncbi:MAG: DEAD/DEAH box helicase [Myxococcales bacterium]|nr:DEAD/DEAH box helicase [Polyangiaceae bacterium]MDW8249904.1 DEAD/DEAH box helicase [Myxococcales bacterium]